MKNTNDIIGQKINEYKKMKFPDNVELEFFEDYGNLIHNLNIGINVKINDDSINEKNNQNVFEIDPMFNNNDDDDFFYVNVIDYDDLFILCHRTYYCDEDFLTFKDKIKANKKLLDKIIDSVSYSDSNIYGFLFNNDSFEFQYDLDNSLITNSIFDNPNYLKSIERIIQLLYIDRIDMFVNEYIVKGMQNLASSYGCKISHNKTSKKLNLFYDKLLSIIGVNQLKKDMFDKYKSLVNNNNKFYSNIQNSYHNLLNLQHSIEHIDKLPYIIDVTISNNFDDDILIELYKDATILNQRYYLELLRMKKKLGKDDLKLNKLELKKSGYEIDKISPSKLNFILHYGNINKLTKIIPFVKNTDLFNLYSDNGIYILVNTEYDIIYNLNNLVSKNVISLKFLENNPRVFFNNDVVNNLLGQYDLLMSNIDLLNSAYNIENSSIEEIVLMDNKVLSDNITILKKYNLNLNVNLLKNIKLLDFIDLFIELDLADYIVRQNEDINEYSYEKVNSIYIGKLVGINDKNPEIMVQMCQDLTKNNDNLDDYIIDDTKSYIPANLKNILDSSERNRLSNVDLTQFDNYLKDNLTYDFGGILISKNKVLRNMYCLEENNFSITDENNIFFSIIYGSILSSEQLEKLKEFIFNKKYTKKLI